MKKLVALLLVLSVVGCTGWPGDECYHWPAAPAATERVPKFWAKLNGANLTCCIYVDDLNGSKPALVPGSNGVGDPAWTTNYEGDGALRMELKAPGTIMGTTPSMGIFSTGLDFKQGTAFHVRGTFQNPTAPLSDNSWTVAVVARTGGSADNDNLGRLQLSLMVVNGKANLRAQEGNDAPGTNKIPYSDKFDITPDTNADAFNDIYTRHLPFTLDLSVNRNLGTGVATLTTPSQTIPIPFAMTVFTKDQGGPLTTVGATLVNNLPGQKISVELTDFKIWSN